MDLAWINEVDWHALNAGKIDEGVVVGPFYCIHIPDFHRNLRSL